ncbi:hypothetical protein DdX_05620 [Ditylenchus destructor]|uniref:Uncharacterized protein n=1 Tax=Ditylenchus destructor TaxID=166010 RepID=A0AAD4RA53_9BILA|nr:hypothetical protein DdX_05620 [Ditylenchus destructor]
MPHICTNPNQASCAHPLQTKHDSAFAVVSLFSRLKTTTIEDELQRVPDFFGRRISPPEPLCAFPFSLALATSAD